MPSISKQFETIDGVKIAIDAESMSKRMLSALREGYYERDEVSLLPPILQEGERIVELGGGLGYVSAVAALSRKIEQIVVFEANPDLIPMIERTHALNGVKSKVVNAVVMPSGDKATVPFYIREDFWASSLSPEPWGYARIVDVPVISFDEMLRAHNPTMLIVDIEGGEVDLFHNVKLTGLRKIFMEVHQSVVGRAGMLRLFDFMSQRDFHYDQWHSSHNVVLFSHVLRS